MLPQGSAGVLKRSHRWKWSGFRRDFWLGLELTFLSLIYLTLCNLLNMRFANVKKRRLQTIIPFLSCILLLGLSSPTPAQDLGLPPTKPRVAQLPDYAQLVLTGLNRPVQLTMVDGSILRGVVGGADERELTLVMDDRSLMESRLRFSWTRISEIRIYRRSRIAEGMLLGGMGGILAGILSPLEGDTNRDYLGIEAPGRVWDTAAQGAVIGAVIGLLQGIDMVLPHAPQPFGTVGPSLPSQRLSRPSMRIVSTVPSQSLTIRDLKESLKGSPIFAEENPFLGGMALLSDQSWNGHTGATIAIETSWQWDQRWWLRSRTEWTDFPRISLETRIVPPEITGLTRIIWREYSSWRTMVGLVRTFGRVKRLPVVEIAFLAGVSRTTLRSHYSVWSATNVPDADLKQEVYRPVIMASSSLALLRRPKLAIALRAEGLMGVGFNADALITDGWEVIPKRRITPIGLSIGLEILFPNF